MKVSLYFSIILGITFMTLRFIGLFLDLTYNNLYLILGLALLFGVSLPLYLIDRHRYRKKIKKIIEDSKADSLEKNTSAKKKKPDEKAVGEYPSFRNQKQGLTWGGGNIHGSTASRGNKRGFLKK